MKLLIDTNNKDYLYLALLNKKKTVAEERVATHFDQSAKLWPALDRLLRGQKVKPVALEGIVAVARGGSFSSVRIGVAVANALGYAWGIPVKDETGRYQRLGGVRQVAPRYSQPAV